MKKLFLALLLVIIVIIGLAGCVPEDQANDITREEFEELFVLVIDNKEEIARVEDRINNMVASVGINQQIDWYENNKVPANTYLSRMAFNYLATTEKDYLDKTKFPDYIWDESENYITVAALNELLVQKYLGVALVGWDIGFQYKINLNKPDDMSNEDFIVRLCMMIVELSNYDFYTIDSPELYIPIGNTGTMYIKVRMSLLVNDKYELHPAIFWEKLLDTRVIGLTYDLNEVETLYQNYVDNNTFDGYVLLNYK